MFFISSNETKAKAFPGLQPCGEHPERDKSVKQGIWQHTNYHSLNDEMRIVGNLSEDGKLASHFQPHQKLRQMLFQGSNPTANNQGGASRLSTTLGSTLSLNDDVSIIVKTL